MSEVKTGTIKERIRFLGSLPLPDRFSIDSCIQALSSSPQNSSQYQIPDEEVISLYITDDNNSLTSQKQVRFSEIPKSETSRFNSRLRKQYSIPNHQTVDEDIYGEALSEFKIKDVLATSTMIEGIFNFNQFPSSSSICINKTFGEDQIMQYSEELVSLVKNFLHQIGQESKTSSDEIDETTPKISRAVLSQKVLQKALETLNFKLSIPAQSPIAAQWQYSPIEENIRLQEQNEDLNDTISFLRDKIEILEIKQMQQYDTISSLKLEIQTRIDQEKLYLQEIDNLKEDIRKLQYCLEDQKHIIKVKRPHTGSLHDISPSDKKTSVSSPKMSENKYRSNITFDDGFKYYGSMLGSMRSGYGMLKKNGNDVYMGFWAQDKYNGCGCLKNLEVIGSNYDYKDLNTVDKQWISYQGEFREGLYHGYGILIFYDQLRFHGQFINGRANGKATIYQNNQLLMRGIWQDNLKI